MPLEHARCIQRRERLLAQVNAATIVISNPRHVLYFTGFWPTPLNITTWGTPHLVIDAANGHTTLLTHDFMLNAETAAVDAIQRWHWYDAVNAPTTPRFPTMVGALSRHLAAVNGPIAAESGWLPHDATTHETIDITATILDMRRRKDPDDLAMLRNCVGAVEAGHRAARSAIQPGASELDVYNAIYAAIVNTAGEPVLPLGDFASGDRAFRGGGPPTERIIQPGDVMIIDLFPVIGGYRADFTATYAASPTLTDTQGKLESALHSALTAGEAQLRPDVRASAVYQAVKTTLDDAGYAGTFPHHAGHGLGLGHPEAPFLVADSTETLQAGDVVTLEPGAYGDDYGGRIEHNYLITPDGFERLTNHDTRFVAADQA